MKKKNSTEALESLNSHLFHSFDPEDENWLVGGSKTITDMLTVTPDGRFDHTLDFEWTWEETKPAA